MSGMGFRLARSQGMEGSTGNLRTYPIADDYDTPIHRGAMVTLTGGNVTLSAVTPGDKHLGIFWGCKFVDTDGSIRYEKWWSGAAGRSNIEAQVAILPAGATALVRGNPASNYTQADIGVRKSFVIPAPAGDNATGQSRQHLANAGATVANAPFTVLQQVDLPDGPWFEVALNGDSAIINSGP